MCHHRPAKASTPTPDIESSDLVGESPRQKARLGPDLGKPCTAKGDQMYSGRHQGQPETSSAKVTVTQEGSRCQ